MKFEYIIKICRKLNLNLLENKFFFIFNFKKLKNLFFSFWKTSSFSDYYWFLYSNKRFTYLKKYF